MRRNDQGQAALVVIMLVALLALLGAAGLTLASYSRQASTGELDRTQALYVAEAGVERAIAKLKIDPLWRDGYIDVSFGGGTINEVKLSELSKTAVNVRVKITSTGSYGSARKTVEADVTISYDPFMCGAGVTDNGGVHIAGDSAVDLTFYSAPSDIAIGDSSNPTNLVFRGGSSGPAGTLNLYRTTNYRVVWGNVYAGGDVKVDRSTTSGYVVRGDVWANGGISGKNYINDGVNDGPDYHEDAGLNIPDFPSGIDTTAADYYKNVALSYGDDNYFNGNKTFTGKELSDMNGVYFVDGKATLDKNASGYTGRATIVAQSIEIDGARITAATTGTNVRGLISLKNTVAIGGNSSYKNVDAVILCGGTLDVQEYLRIRGAVSTRGIVVRQTAGSYPELFRYREDLFRLFPPGMPYTVKIDSWKQL